jgi:ABC-2 type transport system permease protein
MTSVALQTWIQLQRLMMGWRRDARMVLEALMLPVFFLLAVNLVFGRPVTAVTGHDALYGTVPMTALVGAVFGSSAAGIALMRERDEGLLARFWVLPIHRASGLLARFAAETIRIQVSTVVVLATGLLLGFRFTQGLAAAVLWLCIPVLFGVAFWFLATTVAVRLTNVVVAEATGLAVALLVFFSTGFVPLGQYPSWLQPIVHYQPMSCAVDAMRGLSFGGPVTAPMTRLLLWCIGTAAACARPMAAGYRRASTR